MIIDRVVMLSLSKGEGDYVLSCIATIKLSLRRTLVRSIRYLAF